MKFNADVEYNVLEDLHAGDFIVIYNYHLSHLGEAGWRDVRHNIFNATYGLPSSLRPKINLYLRGLFDFSSRAMRRGISVVLVGSAHRNNDLGLRKEWFRLEDLAQLTLKKELENAKFINNILSEKIAAERIDNLSFVNPLRVIDASCGENIELYLSCFRDSDHMSNVSAKRLVNFLSYSFLF